MPVPTARDDRLLPATWLVLVAALVLGTLFRNVWAGDMEWKADEQIMFRRAQEVARTSRWPWTGMSSGVGTPNPGMSLWAFAALSRIASAERPEDLVRAVMIANTLSLVLLTAFATTRAAPEREPWLWTVALAAVSPHQVQLHRKIWAQSILALPVVGFLWAWWARRTMAGAFAWGLLGIALGQIHMSGFFLAAALALFTAFLDRGAPHAERARWRAFAVGTLAGGWPLVPWASEALFAPGGAPRFRPGALLRFGFWQHWLNEVMGLQPEFSLGRWFWTFLGEPQLGAVRTFGVLAAYVVLALAVLYALAGGVRALLAPIGWRRRLGEGAPSRLLVASALCGYGVLVTCAAIRFEPHYMAVLFPLPYLWLARSALAQSRGRAVLAVTVGAYVVVSASFLSFVHERGGAPQAEYGASYRARAERPRGE
jgi:hypothetical protein